MIGGRVVIRRGSKEEAEKPFWISFSDLMSALMVLFLVVMSVALLAATKTVNEIEEAEKQRRTEIEELMMQIRAAAEAFGGLNVERQSIDFGERAQFKSGQHTLSPEQEAALRTFVPKVLEIARAELGQKWLKRIVVEGFTDQRGTYLYNLNLSLQRSQRVLCALMAPPSAGEAPLTPEEKDQVRNLFLVGGYSFNSAKATEQASRRIELRLDFFQIGEAAAAPKPGEQGGNVGACAIGLS